MAYLDHAPQPTWRLSEFGLLGRLVHESTLTGSEDGNYMVELLLDENTQSNLLHLSWSLAKIHDERELQRASVEAIVGLLGVDEVGYDDVRLRERSANSRLFPRDNPADPTRVSDELASVLDDHPVIAHLAVKPAVAPVRLSDLIGSREFQRTRTYEVLFKPRNLRHQLVMPLQLNWAKRSGVAIALNRCNVDFADSELNTALGCQLVLGSLFAAMRARTSPPEGSVEAAQRAGLTAREVELLELLNIGMTADSISRAKRLAPATVRKHLQNIYAKLGIHDRLQVVTYCRSIGIINNP